MAQGQLEMSMKHDLELLRRQTELKPGLGRDFWVVSNILPGKSDSSCLDTVKGLSAFVSVADNFSQALVPSTPGGHLFKDFDSPFLKCPPVACQLDTSVCVPSW
jgi:hypothetical protein